MKKTLLRGMVFALLPAIALADTAPTPTVQRLTDLHTQVAVLTQQLAVAKLKSQIARQNNAAKPAAPATPATSADGLTAGAPPPGGIKLAFPGFPAAPSAPAAAPAAAAATNNSVTTAVAAAMSMTIVSIIGSGTHLTATLQTSTGAEIIVAPGQKLPGGFAVDKITENGVSVARDGHIVPLLFAGSGPVASALAPGMLATPGVGAPQGLAPSQVPMMPVLPPGMPPRMAPPSMPVAAPVMPGGN